MYFARAAKDSPDIPASKAVSGRRYRCPVCDKPVVLRSGQFRTPHFAHISKTANPKCALYHPGSGIVQPILDHSDHRNGQPGEANKIIFTPFVAVALENRSRQDQNDRRRWQFGLVIPKAFDGIGRLKIETGFGSIKSLDLLSLMSGPRFVPINVDERFRISWVSDEADYEYRQALLQEIDEVSQSDGYVFTGSGKIRTRTNILTWGESYIFIWKNPDYSIPRALDHYFIADNQGWRAASVVLPIDHDEAVETWLRDEFGVSIVTGTRQWGIVYPPPLDRGIDGNVTLGSLRKLYLGFSDPDLSDEMIDIQIKEKNVSIKSDGSQKRVAFVSIPPELDNFPLQLTWGARTLHPILRERREGYEHFILIKLRTVSGLIEVGLHHIAAAARLLEVRHGASEIISFQIPKGVVGTLKVRQSTLDWTEVSQFGGMDRPYFLNDLQILDLNKRLRARTSDIRLCFKGFGEFSANAENSVLDHAILKKRLRERMEWYLRLTSHGSTLSNISTLSDAEIVEAVSASTQNPAAVAGRNILLNELKTAGRTSREK